jgi:hypothetical protein
MGKLRMDACGLVLRAIGKNDRACPLGAAPAGAGSDPSHAIFSGPGGWGRGPKDRRPQTRAGFLSRGSNCSPAIPGNAAPRLTPHNSLKHCQ